MSNHGPRGRFGAGDEKYRVAGLETGVHRAELLLVAAGFGRLRLAFLVVFARRRFLALTIVSG